MTDDVNDGPTKDSSTEPDVAATGADGSSDEAAAELARLRAENESLRTQLDTHRPRGGGGRKWTSIVLAFVTAPHAVETRERVPAQTAPLAAPADPRIGGDEA